MRIERLITCPRRHLWRALIQHAELGEHGAILRLALPGGVSASAGKIIAYKSGKMLECAWDSAVLRWELHARGEQTLLVFTHTENAAPIPGSGDVRVA
jgi:hypothetical protein